VRIRIEINCEPIMPKGCTRVATVEAARSEAEPVVAGHPTGCAPEGRTEPSRPRRPHTSFARVRPSGARPFLRHASTGSIPRDGISPVATLVGPFGAGTLVPRMWFGVHPRGKGERRRPACRFRRLAENIGRPDNESLLNISLAPDPSAGRRRERPGRSRSPFSTVTSHPL